MPDVAQLFGWIEGTWLRRAGSDVSADLAMVVEKLADAEDGWGLALDSLRAESDFTADAADLGHRPGRHPSGPCGVHSHRAGVGGDEGAGS